MTYKLRFTTIALKDIQRHKKSGDKKLLAKLAVLLEEMSIHPRKGKGQPEKLKYDLEGLYSRRINKKHRIVYNIKENIITVIVLSAYAHYGDK
jgi:toxin YoeB